MQRLLSVITEILILFSFAVLPFLLALLTFHVAHLHLLPTLQKEWSHTSTPTLFLHPFLFSPYMPHASLISCSWILSSYYFMNSTNYKGDRGVTVVKALCYKPEGRWFDSRWCHWNFSLTQSFRSHYGPGIDSASNRNEYQEYFMGVKSGRCVRLTTWATVT